MTKSNPSMADLNRARHMSQGVTFDELSDPEATLGLPTFRSPWLRPVCWVKGHRLGAEVHLPEGARRIMKSEAHEYGSFSDVRLVPVREFCNRCDLTISRPDTQHTAERIALIEAVLGRCEKLVAPYSCRDANGGKDFFTPYGADDFCLPCRVREIIENGVPMADENGRSVYAENAPRPSRKSQSGDASGEQPQ